MSKRARLTKNQLDVLVKQLEWTAGVPPTRLSHKNAVLLGTVMGAGLLAKALSKDQKAVEAFIKQSQTVAKEILRTTGLIVLPREIPDQQKEDSAQP